MTATTTSAALLVCLFIFSFNVASSSSRSSSTPKVPTFTHVRQNLGNTITATVENNMHCDYAGCVPSTGACCTHIVSCGCGCVSGWTGSRCDQPSTANWVSQQFHYNFTFRQKISVPRWKAAIGSSGKTIGYGSTFTAVHDNNMNALNEPSFRVRVVSKASSLVDGKNANISFRSGRSWIPLKFGRGLGGVCFHGPAQNHIKLEFVNGYTNQNGHGSRVERKNFRYSEKYAHSQYKWTKVQSKASVSVRVSKSCSHSDTSSTNKCTSTTSGARIYVVKDRWLHGNAQYVVQQKSVGDADSNSDISGAQGYSISVTNHGAVATVTGESPSCACSTHCTETRNATVYECRGGYLQLHEKTTFVLDSIQLALNGTRMTKLQVGQHGGRFVDRPIDGCPSPNRCWCKIKCPKGMHHVGTDGSTCMAIDSNSDLPRCDLSHHCNTNGNRDPRTTSGYMIKCEEVEALMSMIGTQYYTHTPDDLYIPPANGDNSVMFGGVHGWQFEGTLYDISIEAMPVEYATVEDHAHLKERAFAKTMDLALLPSFTQESPVEMFVAACNASGCSSYTSSGVSSDTFCTADQTKVPCVAPFCQKNGQ